MKTREQIKQEIKSYPPGQAPEHLYVQLAINCRESVKVGDFSSVPEDPPLIRLRFFQSIGRDHKLN
jgi:hypothetical protein